MNDWLNEHLQRSEFMPFAPVTLGGYPDKCYLELEGAFTSQIMTVTVDCTEWMKNVSPAAVHVDGTARPQLVTKESNSRYYNILKSLQ